MESNILERIRTLEADVERHRDEIVFEQLAPCENARHELIREHYIAKRINLMQKRAQQLLELYGEDEDVAELCAIANENHQEGAQRASDVVVKEAVDAILRQYGSLREYHRTTAANTTPIQAGHAAHEPLAAAIPVVQSMFSSGEQHGKVVDLHPHYRRYLDLVDLENKKRLANRSDATVAIPNVEYKDFVGRLVETFKVFSETQKIEEWNLYKRYVLELHEYLVHFHTRKFPLADAMRKSTQNAVEKRVAELWPRGGLKGWAKDIRYTKPESQQVATAEEQIKDIVDNLMPDVLTTTRDIAGRMIGRNAEELQRAQDEDDAEFTKSILDARKGKEEVVNLLHGGGPKDPATSGVATADDYDITKFAAMQGQEDQQNDDAEEGFAFDASDDIPLDDEGKPIRWHLVKLHGLLNVFKCEICGGEAYKGPKVFHEHFSAERHTSGLKNLGIENKQIFDGVTLIRDALAISNMMEQDAFGKRLREDADEEEIEDAQGNVITAKRHKEMHRGFV